MILGAYDGNQLDCLDQNRCRWDIDYGFENWQKPDFSIKQRVQTLRNRRVDNRLLEPTRRLRLGGFIAGK